MLMSVGIDLFHHVEIQSSRRLSVRDGDGDHDIKSN